VRENEYKPPVEIRRMILSIKSIFSTLFHSLGLFSFSLHFVFSFSHFFSSWLITKRDVFSSEMGKKITFLERSLTACLEDVVHPLKEKKRKVADFLCITIVGDLLISTFCHFFTSVNWRKKEKESVLKVQSF